MPGTTQGTPMPIHKILVVDDSKTELHHLSEILGKREADDRIKNNGGQGWGQNHESVSCGMK